MSKASLGQPAPGWAFTVVLTGQDGFSGDQARGFQPLPEDFQFGVCATPSDDPHCTFDPTKVPKLMDVIPPAGVSQADEVDYTIHTPVVLSGVAIPIPDAGSRTSRAYSTSRRSYASVSSSIATSVPLPLSGPLVNLTGVREAAQVMTTAVWSSFWSWITTAQRGRISVADLVHPSVEIERADDPAAQRDIGDPLQAGELARRGGSSRVHCRCGTRRRRRHGQPAALLESRLLGPSVWPVPRSTRKLNQISGWSRSTAISPSPEPPAVAEPHQVVEAELDLLHRDVGSQRIECRTRPRRRPGTDQPPCVHHGPAGRRQLADRHVAPVVIAGSDRDAPIEQLGRGRQARRRTTGTSRSILASAASRSVSDVNRPTSANAISRSPTRTWKQLVWEQRLRLARRHVGRCYRGWQTVAVCP